MTGTVIPFISGDSAVVSVAAGVTTYATLGSGGSSIQSGTVVQASSEVNYETAGTFAEMYVLVGNNSINTGSSTVKVQVAGSNGNQTVSIGAAATGGFQDTTHNDSVSANTLFNYAIVASGSTGTLGLTGFNTQFTPTTTGNTVNKWVFSGSLSLSQGGALSYQPLAGNPSTNGTEANAQFKAKDSFTLSNLFVHQSAAGFTNVFVTRIGGGNGNCTITSTGPGNSNDTTHNDSISSGNLINYKITN